MTTHQCELPTSLTDAQELARLDKHLREYVYIGGDHPSHFDNVLIQRFHSEKVQVDAKTYPYLSSWYYLLSVYVPAVRDQWTHDYQVKEQARTEGKKKAAEKPAEQQTSQPAGQQTSQPAAKTETKPAADDVDLFGDDDEEEQKKMEELKKKKAAEKPKKEAPIAKSIVIFDVKIWEPDNYDYNGLATKILALQINGLVWKTEYKLADLAFGVKKIVIGCVVEDEKCSVDEVTEFIQETFPDDIQSIDIAAFNKI